MLTIRDNHLDKFVFLGYVIFYGRKLTAEYICCIFFRGLNFVFLFFQKYTQPIKYLVTKVVSYPNINEK